MLMSICFYLKYIRLHHSITDHFAQNTQYIKFSNMNCYPVAIFLCLFKDNYFYLMNVVLIECNVWFDCWSFLLFLNSAEILYYVKSTLVLGPMANIWRWKCLL